MINFEQKYAALLAQADAKTPAAVAGMRLCFEALALAAAIDRDCADRLAAHGLSEGRFVLLFLLAEAKGGLSPHELAERAGVTRGTITGLLDGLERAALARRFSHDVDRRKLTVQLTPKGRALARKLVAEHSQWIGAVFSGFTQSERALLSRLLTKAYLQTDTGARAGKP
jgi:DNA-binding MarR family transcriptional regulator